MSNQLVVKKMPQELERRALPGEARHSPSAEQGLVFNLVKRADECVVKEADAVLEGGW